MELSTLHLTHAAILINNLFNITIIIVLDQILFDVCNIATIASFHIVTLLFVVPFYLTLWATDIIVKIIIIIIIDTTSLCGPWSFHSCAFLLQLTTPRFIITFSTLILVLFSFPFRFYKHYSFYNFLIFSLINYPAHLSLFILIPLIIWTSLTELYNSLS
jgi:hypothetical protein